MFSMRYRLAISSFLILSCCAIETRAGVPLPLTAEVVVAGTEGLVDPVFVTHAPGDFGRVFIIEQPGRIRILDISQNPPVLVGTPFLDIVSRVNSVASERGLLGLAFHPNYSANGFFYVDYTDVSGNTNISRFQVSAGNPDLADSASEVNLFTIAQPQSNHNGGWLSFSPVDGFLYIGTGDGGNFNDVGTGHTANTGNSQDITNNLLGKMLRIDVDTKNSSNGKYGIPASNPFVGVTGDDEIWAYGLRNPWRNAFDRDTGDLIIADVGQNAWEEINFQLASSTGGENWGWRCREGAHDFASATTLGCDTATLLDPIHEYSHGVGCSITGGEVYRGCGIADLGGTYFFADFCSASIWSFQVVGGVVTGFQDRTAELASTGSVIGLISSFGLDAFGEIYICDIGGEVFRIIADGAPNACQTDCMPACVNGVCVPGAMATCVCDPGWGGADCSTPVLLDVAPASGESSYTKDRYISFVPATLATVPLALRVKRAGAATPWYVSCTLADLGAEGRVGTLVQTAEFCVWSRETIHVNGCEIVPGNEYVVDATQDDVSFSTPLSVFTTAPQFAAGRHFGDTVGTLVLNEWTPPEGLVTANDIVAVVQKFSNITGPPHLARVDTDGKVPNIIIAGNDILRAVVGFAGESFGFGAVDCLTGTCVPSCP